MARSRTKVVRASLSAFITQTVQALITENKDQSPVTCGGSTDGEYVVLLRHIFDSRSGEHQQPCERIRRSVCPYPVRSLPRVRCPSTRPPYSGLQARSWHSSRARQRGRVKEARETEGARKRRYPWAPPTPGPLTTGAAPKRGTRGHRDRLHQPARRGQQLPRRTGHDDGDVPQETGALIGQDQNQIREASRRACQKEQGGSQATRSARTRRPDRQHRGA